MSKEQLGARVDKNGSLYKDFERFEKSGGFESRSEAIRAVMRAGLKEKNTGPLDERPDSTLAALLWNARRKTHTFVMVALVSVVLMLITTGMVSFVFGGLAVSYAVVVILAAVDKFVLNNSLTVRLMDISDRVTVEVDT